MALRTLGPKQAAALDQELMSTGGFSIDQLMELAGLSVAEAGMYPLYVSTVEDIVDAKVIAYKVHPISKGKEILIACGPGNNGGDGLVAARHLYHFGYKPTVYYPKPSKPDLFQRLQTQLKSLQIPFTDDFHGELSKTSLVIDSIFGFSFKGPPRDPFSGVIQELEKSSIPVLAVDAPSSWDIENGPPAQGEIGGNYMPDYLISLTAAKPFYKHFKGKRHFIGGRFLSKEVAEKYELDVPDYQGVDQIVEVSVGGEGKL